MTKLGILINHYDARNDVRDLVEELSKRTNVVLISSDKDLRLPVPQGVEVRYLKAAHHARRWIWSRIFRWFGRLPKTRENYRINELFKFGRLSWARRIVANAQLALQMMMPRVISINFYMDRVAKCDQTPLDDISEFLLFTEFSDVPVTARICNSGRPSWGYLYSWDHPCKHTVLTDRLTGYMAWNARLVDDLVLLQEIPRLKCHVVGATQLAPIASFLISNGDGREAVSGLEGRPYFYFGCGTGYPNLVREEVALLEKLADAIAIEFPQHLLLVRPYPMFNDDSFMGSLRKRPNVRMDDGYRSRQAGRGLAGTDVSARLLAQSRCDAFLHVGTTMGFEGAYLGTPTVFINLATAEDATGANLSTFAKQYHVQKYLCGDYPMVVRTVDEAVRVLRMIAKNPRLAAEYNCFVAGGAPLLRMSEIAERILGMMGARPRHHG